jgi:hypothetical protein
MGLLIPGSNATITTDKMETGVMRFVNLRDVETELSISQRTAMTEMLTIWTAVALLVSSKSVAKPMSLQLEQRLKYCMVKLVKLQTLLQTLRINVSTRDRSLTNSIVMQELR